MTGTKPRFTALVLCMAITLGASGCNQAPPEGPPPPPPTVKVSVPLAETVTDYADFTGRTSAVESVSLRARVMGHLEKIDFTEGADVKKGDLLFLIDQRPYQAALARAEAEVAQGEARYSRLLSDQKRAQSLVISKAISQEDLSKIVGDVAETAALVKSAEASREIAKLNLDYTEVRAPVSGQVGRAMITVGNFVESGSTVLTTIMSIDPMYAYFDVDDQTYVKVRHLVRKSSLDTPTVQLGLTNEPGYPHVGKLRFVDNQVDAGTGTLRMRATFANPDRLLTPGLFVRIRVALGSSHDALLVSDRAIDTDQGQKIVFVVNQDKIVEKRLVQVGGLHRGLREILKGVKANEQVIVEGIQRVRAGAVVSPETIAMPGLDADKK